MVKGDFMFENNEFTYDNIDSNYAHDVVEETFDQKDKTEGLVTEKALNIRTTPEKTSGNILKIVKEGTVLEVVDVNSEWCEVIVDGQTGYCMKDFIEIV